MTAAIAAASAILSDRLLGELGVDPHPVAVFGNAMSRIERRMYRDTRPAGTTYVLLGIAVAASAGRLAPTALSAHVAIGGRMLADVAIEIGRLLEDGDLAGARTALPALVGRDPSALDAAEISRAVVESVAENTVDAVVAPAFWTAVLGGGGAAGYRAVNTLDAMVGHHSARYERFGWAAARVDDVANFVPARLTAMLVMTARPRYAAEVARVVRRDAGAHPSPNAGVAEAAFAAALGLRLGGENHYDGRVDVRSRLGNGRSAESSDIARAVRLSRDVGALLAAALGAIGIAGRRRRRRTVER